VGASDPTSFDLAGGGIEEPLVRGGGVVNGGRERRVRNLGEPRGVRITSSLGDEDLRPVVR